MGINRMIIKYFVNNLDEFIGFFPIYKSETRIYYLFVWHKQLSLIKNIISNLGIGTIYKK